MNPSNLFTMKIYVGTYAQYNNGSLYGEWINLDEFCSIDEFYKRCKALHMDESDPEYMFQDWEQIPDNCINESWVHPKLWDFMNLDEHERTRVTALSNLGHSLEEAMEAEPNTVFIEKSTALDYIFECYPELENLNNFLSIDWKHTESNFFTDWQESVDEENVSYYICGN